MRPLLLFLALLLAFFAILKFYPESDPTVVVGGAPAFEEVGGAGETGFLTRPPGHGGGGAVLLERPDRPAGRIEAPAPTPEEAELPPESQGGWMDSFDGIARAGAEEVELAGLMVRDRCDGLGNAIRELGERLSSDRGRLIYAFGLAYQGDAPGAVEVAGQITGSIAQMEERSLQRMIEGAAPPLSPERASSYGPMALAMSMLATERMVEEDRSTKAWAQAASGLSELLLAELRAPWGGSRERLVGWAKDLNEVQERHRWNPRGTWESAEVEVQSGDSLTSVLARYRRANPGIRISTGLVEKVNDIRNSLIHAGQVLQIPTGEVRVEVSLEQRLLFVSMDDEVVAAWECAVGAEGQETTPGDFAAGDFGRNPTHFPRGKPPVYYGDPEHPLGTRWISWADPDGTKNSLSLGFHGTNKPETVGFAASKGCVRLKNRDVEVLYALLPSHAPIHVE